MSHPTGIAIRVTILIALAGAIGYGYGEQRRTAEQLTEQEKHLKEHEDRLRAQAELLHVIAEDYKPGPGKRHKLPEGWVVHEGGTKTYT